MLFPPILSIPVHQLSFPFFSFLLLFFLHLASVLFSPLRLLPSSLLFSLTPFPTLLIHPSVGIGIVLKQPAPLSATFRIFAIYPPSF